MATGNVINEVGIGGDQDKIKWGGLITSSGDVRGLQPGDSADMLNWITGRNQDNIQLRRGQTLLGVTRRTGGNVTGLGVGQLGSVQVPYYTANKSVYYFNATTGDTQEVNSTNLLAATEDMWFVPYQNLAGSFLYFGSPHTSVYKVPIASSGDVVDQKLINYQFVHTRIDQNRMWGVGRYGKLFAPDLTSTYISGTDRQNFSAYPTPAINESIGTGTGGVKTFTGTISTTAPSTIFGVLVAGATDSGHAITAMGFISGQLTVTTSGHTYNKGDYVFLSGVTSTGDPVNGNIATVITGGTGTIGIQTTAAVGTFTYGSGGTIYPCEVFTDQGSGALLSNLGGTGTVDYSTGVVAVTFNTAPANGTTIIANNYSEDSTTGGILNFTATTTPVLTDPYQFIQTGGGSALATAGYQGIGYVLHQTRTWNIQLPTSATALHTDATNNQYWAHIGIPYPRAIFETGDGVLYVDNTNPATPKFSKLEIPPNSTSLTVVPTWISQDLDLSNNFFDHAIAFQWGEYNIYACKQPANGQALPNNTVFYIQNIFSGKWNVLDYSVNALAEFAGGLLSGDSLSPNMELLFSGVDDDGVAITNYWTSAAYDFGFNGTKKVKFLTIEGLIQSNQSIQVNIALDLGEFFTVFTIRGNGAYVNGDSVAVGQHTVGSSTLGGGEEIFGQPFVVDIPIFTDYFQNIQVQFSAQAIGWAQINRMAYKVITMKRRRLSSTAEGIQE
jgi:hypothetical protein